MPLPGAQAALAFVAAAGYAAVGRLICGKAEETESASGPSTDAERLTLGDSETADWPRVAGSRVLPVTGILVVTAGIVVGFTTGWVPALPLVITGVPMALLTITRPR
ncbi:hypothetical protein [Streptomyces hesseae]|uniref:Integral membrane protein n=1 Tax=Streptomyces hesseae TaxID=3075519 RepID=A0ABU2SKV6_9ACTN|nr:hypothetical protein [Streptomyces sp. DSM 40473]MDT0448544.1 hypothetical protein [Streptomyces sp. DSM 40473]